MQEQNPNFPSCTPKTLVDSSAFSILLLTAQHWALKIPGNKSLEFCDWFTPLQSTQGMASSVQSTLHKFEVISDLLQCN